MIDKSKPTRKAGMRGTETAGTYAFEGDTVRVLLRGKDTHSLLGQVIAASHKGVNLYIPERSKQVFFPASALMMLELETHDGAKLHWVVATLPPSLKAAFTPLKSLMLTGAGALPKDVTPELIDRAIFVLKEVEPGLLREELRDTVVHLQASLRHLRSARTSADFEESSHHKDRALEELRNAQTEIERFEDDDVVEIRRFTDRVKRLVELFWARHVQQYVPRPTLVTPRVPPAVSIQKSGEIELPVRIRLQGNYAPASKIDVLFEDSPEIDLLDGDPRLMEIRPGETRTVPCRAVLRSMRQPSRMTLKLRGQLKYQVPGGGTQLSPVQTLEYDLVPEAQFEKIGNPYRAYAGGTAVEDPEMFFGRTNLLNELTEELARGPVGQSFALYGQKRTGKTSLIEQIRLRCEGPPLIVASISFGILDTSNLTVSFVRAVLEQIRVSLLGPLGTGDYERVRRAWPSDDAIERRPIESLMSTLISGRSMLKKYPGWRGLRYVLLIDEFTYLFEIWRNAEYGEKDRQDVREFLRQWKALLESRAFSSVVVGQDTMPYFMQHFPNEFSAMRAQRLSYLDVDETRNLADEPIRLPGGTSRYTGYALESVYQHTAGHPYFTQVLCDRLVDLANERRKSVISESAVEEAVESLVAGAGRLDPYRFDCLLSADNTGLVALRGDESEVLGEELDPASELSWAVLARIAQLSGPSGRVVSADEVLFSELDVQVLEDLRIRDVVDTAGGLRIRVNLFGEYLRRNS